MEENQQTQEEAANMSMTDKDPGLASNISAFEKNFNKETETEYANKLRG